MGSGPSLYRKGRYGEMNIKNLVAFLCAVAGTLAVLAIRVVVADHYLLGDVVAWVNKVQQPQQATVAPVAPAPVATPAKH